MPTTVEPRVKELPFRRCPSKFFYGTPLAKEWYDPIVPFVRAEIDWILENIELKNQRIIDGGAHHGLYSIIFAVGSGRTSEVISVDPVIANCALIEVNMALNKSQVNVKQCAISDSDGSVLFSYGSNGQIVSRCGWVTPSKRLPSIMKGATIVKLDVEGSEFIILPHQIDEMAQVHTWVVEVHPSKVRDHNFLINLFREKGFQLFWINREDAIVEPYPNSAVWKGPATIFALRKRTLKFS